MPANGVPGHFQVLGDIHWAVDRLNHSMKHSEEGEECTQDERVLDSLYGTMITLIEAAGKEKSSMEEIIEWSKE